MSWITLAAVLVGWLLAGLGVAYLFGHFVREAEPLARSGNLPSSVVRYLRRAKRATTLPRTSSRAPAQIKARRAAGGGRRH
jgi:hypothetical protein